MAQIVSNATISSEKDQLLDVYAEFHKQNSDFVGWISLDGTSLDYPIMQNIDAPEYYLRRDFNKNYSLAGTPFLDAPVSYTHLDVYKRQLFTIPK